MQLGQGETCLLFSDGVTEARGGIRGEQFGTTRLVEALQGCSRMPAPALAERVEQVCGDWLGGRDHDDIAVFAIRAVPPGAAARHLRVVP
ncbi:SpoIIE family protein phosphatase [Plantactinospora veratri]